MKSKVIHKNPIMFNEEELPMVWVHNFSPEAASDFQKYILQLETDPEVSDIFVYIMSYGGEMFPALSMIETILNCSKPVHTVGSGMCASAGGFLLACGTGTRWMGANSYMHLHHAHGENFGDIPEREQDLKQVKIVQNRIFQLVTKRSTLTPKQLSKKISEEESEWQLSATEALKYKFIDKIGMPVFKRYMVTEYE